MRPTPDNTKNCSFTAANSELVPPLDVAEGLLLVSIWCLFLESTRQTYRYATDAMESKLRPLSSVWYGDSLRFQRDEPDSRRRIPPLRHGFRNAMRG